MTWKLVPFKHVSIKKWLKEIKQRRKEEQRLKKAEVHAAISVAGVAAALAAIAAESGEKDGTRDSAIASAAALVAAQCAKVAEAMGAKKEQLSGVIGSAISGTTSSEIVTLVAAASTCKNFKNQEDIISLFGKSCVSEKIICIIHRVFVDLIIAAIRGADTLKARTGCKSGLNGSSPVLPLEDNNELVFDFEKCRSVLAKGAELNVETSDGMKSIIS